MSTRQRVTTLPEPSADEITREILGTHALAVERCGHVRYGPDDPRDGKRRVPECRRRRGHETGEFLSDLVHAAIDPAPASHRNPIPPPAERLWAWAPSGKLLRTPAWEPDPPGDDEPDTTTEARPRVSTLSSRHVEMIARELDRLDWTDRFGDRCGGSPPDHVRLPIPSCQRAQGHDSDDDPIKALHAAADHDRRGQVVVLDALTVWDGQGRMLWRSRAATPGTDVEPERQPDRCSVPACTYCGGPQGDEERSQDEPGQFPPLTVPEPDRPSLSAALTALHAAAADLGFDVEVTLR